MRRSGTWERNKSGAGRSRTGTLTALRIAAGCHVLFVPATHEAPLSQALAALDGAAVLTIGETTRFTNAGGIIAFVYRKNQLRFVINLNAATHAGLRIRSQLLTLAVAVQQAGHR